MMINDIALQVFDSKAYSKIPLLVILCQAQPADGHNNGCSAKFMSMLCVLRRRKFL